MSNKPTLAQVNAQIESNARIASEREQRIADCVVESTDCALSMWASDINAAKLRLQKELAEKNWMEDRFVLYRNGVRVNGHRVETKFGPRWVINNEWFPVYYADDTPRRQKNFLKHGFTWVKETLPVHIITTGGSFIGAPMFHVTRTDEKEIISCPVVA